MLALLASALAAVALATLATRLVMFRARNAACYAGKHVVITGGSLGLGLALGEQYCAMRARVTLMARTRARLDEAKAALLAKHPGCAVQVVAVDVGDYARVCAALNEAVALQGGEPIHSLFMNAGKAQTGYFLDLEPKVFAESMALNYMGCVNCAKAVVPMMVQSKTKGELVFIASAAAFASFIGYSAYAPTKAAVRSLSDALRNELKGFGISVHIAYPPDMDTPGFEEENKTKPKETLLVSPPEVFSPHACAVAIVQSLLRREYHLAGPDPVQNLLASTMTSITPRGRWAPLEMLLAPLIAVAMLAFNFHADRVAVTYGKRVLGGA
jgi:3-dehydrosphinganine reductase